jgi:hypothetical protein
MKTNLWSTINKLLSFKKLIVVLLILLLAMFGLSQILGWDSFCCVHADIDKNSGAIRYSRYIFFFKVIDNIEETTFSKKVRSLLPENLKPDWKRDFTKGTILYKVYYDGPYHGAIQAVKRLSTLIQEGELTDAQVLRSHQYLVNGKIDLLFHEHINHALDMQVND